MPDLWATLRRTVLQAHARRSVGVDQNRAARRPPQSQQTVRTEQAASKGRAEVIYTLTIAGWIIVLIVVLWADIRRAFLELRKKRGCNDA